MLHLDLHHEKVTSEATHFYWVCPGMPSHAQTWLDLPKKCISSYRQRCGLAQ